MYDRAFARRVNDHVHGLVALPMPTGHRIRLMTANGTPTVLGTEAASGGGYSAGVGAPIADYLPSTDATPTLSALEVGILISGWPRAETIVGIELWAMVGGVATRLELGALDSPMVLTVGDNARLDPAAIASALQ